jgi:hypothetical protein
MKLAVVNVNQDVMFQGTRDECYAFMRTHKGCHDLRYINEGRLGRFTSWIL